MSYGALFQFIYDLHVMIKSTSSLVNMVALFLATVALLQLPRSVATLAPSAGATATDRQPFGSDHQSSLDDEMLTDDGLRQEPDYQLMAANDEELANAMRRWYLTQQQAQSGGSRDSSLMPSRVDASSGRSQVYI